MYGANEDTHLLGGASGSEDSNDWRRFGVLVGIVQVAFFVLFAMFVVYPPDHGEHEAADSAIQYIFYLDVTVMMLVGFGYLMTFMRKYTLGAVGLTFLITVISIPLCTLTGRLFASLGQDAAGYPEIAASVARGEGYWPPVELNNNALLNGNFAAAAVLISFGAVIGKLTPAQVVLMVLFEIPIYSFNKEFVAIGMFQTLDMGGTIFIHLFGAYFGLAFAWVLGKPAERDQENAEASHISDIFSLIGTTFLWIYWPSFNGATALGMGNQQILTTANTVMALTASCMVAFTVSAFINGKISTVDIQNATLAGGVAVGAASNLKISPAAAMAIGSVAATVSCFGFNKLQKTLEATINLHDSCGVHNLHGMPAIVGSIAVCIATSFPSTAGIVVFPRGASQPIAQLEGMIATLIVSIVGGLLSGVIVKGVFPNKGPAFTDGPFWTVAPSFDKQE
jgi:ammonium transporter Rh